MNTLRALRTELSDAPPAARRTAWTGILIVLLVLGAGVWDLSSGRDAGELLRWTAALIGSVGLLLFVVADVLHRTGRVRSERGRPGSEEAPGSERFRLGILRKTYLVLPRLALAGAGLLALAAGMMVVVGTLHVRFWIAAVLFGAYALRATRTVIGSARDLYGEARSQRELAHRARSEADEARLLALQARMNPHFLFNALNTVASLVRTDPKAAERTVESLASVLRQTLRRSERVWGTVAEEVGCLEAYLAVERERWDERLDVRLEVEPAALSGFLPPMTLQPLVENALEHGPGTRLEGGLVNVTIDVEEGDILATVWDDGPGMALGASEGTGLGNLRERLSTLYGGTAQMTIESNRNGTTVRLRLPAKPPGRLVPEPGDGVAATAEVPCAS